MACEFSHDDGDPYSRNDGIQRQEPRQ
jgi:hypothetical protein